MWVWPSIFAEKTFTDRPKTSKFVKVLSLESFSLYGKCLYLSWLHEEKVWSDAEELCVIPRDFEFHSERNVASILEGNFSTHSLANTTRQRHSLYSTGELSVCVCVCVCVCTT